MSESGVQFPGVFIATPAYVVFQLAELGDGGYADGDPSSASVVHGSRGFLSVRTRSGRRPPAIGL